MCNTKVCCFCHAQDIILTVTLPHTWTGPQIPIHNFTGSHIPTNLRAPSQTL